MSKATITSTIFIFVMSLTSFTLMYGCMPIIRGKAWKENIGLRQAFFTAGAATILSTLWAIEDDSAPQFMKELYCALVNDKQSPATALANTQRKWIAVGESLREWGGYVMHGAP
jgi:CHAT domain-containing protein